MAAQEADSHSANLQDPRQQREKIGALQYLKACLFASGSATMVAIILWQGLNLYYFFKHYPDNIYQPDHAFEIVMFCLLGIVMLMVNIIIGIPALILLRLLQIDYVSVATATGVVLGLGWSMAGALDTEDLRFIFISGLFSGLLGGVCGMVSSYSVWGNSRKIGMNPLAGMNKVKVAISALWLVLFPVLALILLTILAAVVLYPVYQADLPP